MPPSRQVREASHPDVSFISTVGDQVKRLKVLAKNYRKYTRILPRAFELFVAQNVCVPADANLFDLTNNNCNSAHSNITFTYNLIRHALISCRSKETINTLACPRTSVRLLQPPSNVTQDALDTLAS